jgi:RND superfamily putative drug exporter
LVAGLWFGSIAVVAIASLGIMGIKLSSVASTVSSENIEAAEAVRAFEGAGAITQDILLVVVNHPALKVTDPAYQATVQDISKRLRAVSYDDNGTTKAAFSAVVDYYLFKNAALASGDGTTTRIVAPFVGARDEAEPKYQAAKLVLDQLEKQYPDYRIYTYSFTSFADELLDVVNHDLESSIQITMPATFIILIISFGALVAAAVPLVLASTALIAAFSLEAIYSNLVGPVGTNTGHIIVLIGLAVGIDYSLFMITRYRAERRKGRDKLKAIEIASGTAGRAVFFSGMLVIISLAGLFMINSPSFTEGALGTITVVLVSMLGSLTFLPATLAILGNGIDLGRVPYFGRERPETSGLWSAIVRWVMRRPAFFTVLLVALLAGLATPVLHLKLGDTTNIRENWPKGMQSNEALNLMAQKWPQGTTLTLDVVIKADAPDRQDVKAAIDKFKAAGVELKGLSAPEVTVAPDKKVTKVSFVMAGETNSEENRVLMQRVRTELIPAYFKDLKGVQVYVGGWVAVFSDLVEHYAAATPWVFTFVLSLSFLLLLVAFRSLVIPLKAILLNLLSTGAAYGVLVLVFQDGWFSDIIGFKPTPVIESYLPLFLFTILFGLSMDYHLFVLTRIKEERDRGASSVEAVARGISATSGTVTSAAAIMVVVFGVFVTLQLMAIRQMGLGLAVAVFMDATIIRSILLPASMKLLGDWNWWLPKFLNWLPHITIEAETEEQPEPAVPLEPEVNYLSSQAS